MTSPPSKLIYLIIAANYQPWLIDSAIFLITSMDTIKHWCSSVEKSSTYDLRSSASWRWFPQPNQQIGYISYPTYEYPALHWFPHVVRIEGDAHSWRSNWRGFADIGEGDDLVCIGSTKSGKPCHRLVWTTDEGAKKLRNLEGCVEDSPKSEIGLLMVS